MSGGKKTPEPSERPGTGKLAPGLYLVATPIGNLGDASRRMIDTLAAVDRIAAEDTRGARRLCTALAIRPRRLERYDDHASDADRRRILDAIRAGEAVALISDAGMPLIADPGFKLVRAAREAGIGVTSVPGPSAPLAALALSGLPTDRFLFAGFLPAKAAARRTALAALAGIDATLVVLETAPRLAASLADMAATLGPARPAAVVREITKLFEETRAAALGALALHYAEAGAPKGEIVVVIGAPAAASAPDADELAAGIDARLDAALASLSLRDAVAAVAGATGQPRRAVYARALARAGLASGKGR